MDTSFFDEEYESESTAFGFEIGPRLRWPHFFVGLGFVHCQLSVNESDPEGGLAIRAIDVEYQGVAFTAGGGF